MQSQRITLRKEKKYENSEGQTLVFLSVTTELPCKSEDSSEKDKMKSKLTPSEKVRRKIFDQINKLHERICNECGSATYAEICSEGEEGAKRPCRISANISFSASPCARIKQNSRKKGALPPPCPKMRPRVARAPSEYDVLLGSVGDRFCHGALCYDVSICAIRAGKVVKRQKNHLRFCLYDGELCPFSENAAYR